MLDMFWQYNGDSLYLAAFLAGCALLCYTEKKKHTASGTKIGKKTAAALLLSLLFVFNELAYRLIGMITEAKTYYRFFWMLPVLFTIAYQLTRAFTSGQKKQMIIAAFVFAACLGVGGNFFINRTNISRPQNIYGLAPDTLAAADAIMRDWGSGQEEKPVAAFDMYLEYQVRTYEPRILWAISRKAYLYQAEHGYGGKKYALQQRVIAAVNEGIKGDAVKLQQSLEKLGVDYLVIRTAFDMDDYLSGISVYPAAKCENYTVYRVGD